MTNATLRDGIVRVSIGYQLQTSCCFKLLKFTGQIAWVGGWVGGRSLVHVQLSHSGSTTCQGCPAMQSNASSAMQFKFYR